VGFFHGTLFLWGRGGGFSFAEQRFRLPMPAAGYCNVFL